ncbi:hypothetical protein [Streptomyces chartreusis]|uniref:hypothetical protein n=1 Tax=Streptomyces chartreusis TaxID=1969 RepID=UPI00380B039C
MVVEPPGQGLGAFGQYHDGTSAFHVDQHGPVVVAATESEVVDAEHPHTARGRIGQGPDETQERVLADPDGLPFGEPSAGPTAHSQRDVLADFPWQHRAAAMPKGQSRDLLGKVLFPQTPSSQKKRPTCR